FFFQAEDGIRVFHVTGVQTCALPIWQSERDLLGQQAPSCSRPGCTCGCEESGATLPAAEGQCEYPCAPAGRVPEEGRVPVGRHDPPRDGIEWKDGGSLPVRCAG